MNKLIAILLLSTVTCFGDSKFVRGKFVSGAMPYAYVAPPSNGLLNNIKSYWSYDSSGTPSAGSAAMSNNGGGAAFIGSGLINSGVDCPLWGDSTAGFYALSTLIDISKDFTASVWVAPYEASGPGGQCGTILNLINGYSQAFGFSLDQTGAQVSYNFTDGVDNGGGSAAVTWSANEWIHFVFVNDSTNGELNVYINGVYTDTVGTLPMTTTVNCELDVLTDFLATPFGCGSTYARSDEVGVWQTKLTPTQISTLYNSGSGYPFSSFNN
tara:strand:+ start:151 stop:957 length:807 start_codon:yes stop_codon:yes gene_type:complete